MNNNKNTKPSAFDLGAARSETLTSVDVFDTEASEVDQYQIREYFAGVFAGLNMRLGRYQNEVDNYTELGEDDLARETEKQCEALYALILNFARRYLY